MKKAKPDNSCEHGKIQHKWRRQMPLEVYIRNIKFICDFEQQYKN